MAVVGHAAPERAIDAVDHGVGTAGSVPMPGPADTVLSCLCALVIGARRGRRPHTFRCAGTPTLGPRRATRVRPSQLYGWSCTQGASALARVL